MRSASLKSENEIPFRLGYRRHRQTIPSPQDGHVGIALLHHTDDSGDAREVAAGVIEKGRIAYFHRVPQHVSRLVIAHPVPGRGLSRHCGKVIDAEGVGLGFHEPMIHCASFGKISYPDSDASASRRTSHASGNTHAARWRSKARSTSRGPFQWLR